MKNTYIFLIAIFIAFSTSCDFTQEQAVEIEGAIPQLVVYCNLDNSEFTIKQALVTKTRKIGEDIVWDFNSNDSITSLFDNKTVFKNNFYGYNYDTAASVKVEIFENDNLISQMKGVYTKYPLFETDKPIKIKENAKYKLKVSAPNFETVTAEQIAPTSVLPNRIGLIRDNFVSKNQGIISELQLDIKDPANQSNSYFIVASLSIQNRSNSSDIQNFRVPIVKIDPNATYSNITSDKNFDGQNYTWRVGLNILSQIPVDTAGRDLILNVSFSTVSSDLERFFTSLESRGAALNNAFSEPTTPFYNVKGGYGIFSITGKDTLKQFIIK
jgi:hypothetical protein